MGMKPRVPFIRPLMPDAEVLAADFASISTTNWYTNFGPQEQAFRRGIADFLGGHLEVVTVSNATIGLMAALASLLPRGAGGEAVATASFTFAAGAQAIAWHGYRPVWIDVDPESLQPSLGSFRELLGKEPDVRAILLTNTFGIGTADISEWEAEAAALGIPLIIDSAAGFGSAYPSGELLGHRGDCEVFSFHATKPFAIGEGGAIVTRDVPLAARMREFTNFGFHGQPPEASAAGLNGKLQEINAAIGLRQLSGFGEVLRERRMLLERYLRRLEGLPLSMPPGTAESSGCFAPIVAGDPETRDAALVRLDEYAVDARNYYSPPVHLHRQFRRFEAQVSLENSESLARRMLSLPVLPRMTDDEFERVCSAIEHTASAE